MSYIHKVHMTLGLYIGLIKLKASSLVRNGKDEDGIERVAEIQSVRIDASYIVGHSQGTCILLGTVMHEFSSV